MKKIRLTEDDDIIDIRCDNVFKAVFTKGSLESRTALSRLVSAMIERDVEIVRIMANEPPVENLRDRGIRFDINCRAGDGEPVNVEMSLNPDPREPVRLEYYAGRLFTGQDIKGAEKSYGDLKRTYQIALLAKERFFTDVEFYHVFEFYDPVNKIPLNGKTRIITIELSKLGKVMEKPISEMDHKELWAVFIECLTDKKMRDKLNEILEREEGIAMAGKVLMTISKDEIERARLLSEYKYEVDRQSQLVCAKREGRKEGFDEGREYFLSLINQGLSTEEIKQRLERR